ncbi:MAG TPA: protein-L-isoaspartate O-methyltransferase [Rhodospirillaceae bacterium]|nr:protein-L-isoaspartate O-methyltransferase [Rhodospirillaceae bacterium]
MDFAAARRNMIDCQVLPNRVTDERIIAAMEDMPREVFAPESKRAIAYVDEALPIGGGRYMMEPMVTARLLQAAHIGPDDVVLCIGCGSGYAPALLAKLANTVVVVESDKAMASQAQETLAGLGIDTVAVIDGKMANGYPKQAPYDVIFFNGGVPKVPEKIEKQLAEGGRLVAVRSNPDNALGTAVLAVRYDDVVSSRDLFDAGTPDLPGFELEAAFSF